MKKYIVGNEKTAISETDYPIIKINNKIAF